jgi:hypothetical protein
MRKKTILSSTLVLMALILFSACSKEEMKLPDSKLNNLFSKWKMEYSYGGDDGLIHQMEDDHIIEFNRKGEYKYTNNGKVKCKLDYEFIMDENQIFDPPYIIHFEKDNKLEGIQNNSHIHFKSSDTLELIIPCCDIPTLVFVRIE